MHFQKLIPMTIRFMLISWILFLVSLELTVSAQSDRQSDLWKQHVEPLFRKHCFQCHGSAKKSGELDLRTIDSIMNGGSRGEAIVRGNPLKSHLFLYLQKGIKPHMPPKKQLAKEEIEIVKTWILRLGKSDAIAALTPSPEGRPKKKVGPGFLPKGIDPVLAIDLAIQKRWQEEDRKPVPSGRCTDETFVRRVYLDVAGRIPTTNERNQFLQSTRSDKRTKLIDRLLASGEFSQHLAELFDAMLMGRHGERKRIGREKAGWVDYLEKSFRNNKPWNQMVKEILLARPTRKEEAGAVWFLYERNNRHQEIAESISSSLFGIQIDCAQCHNHPLADEILQEHYWGLVAFFNRGKNANLRGRPQVLESAIGGFSQFTDLEGKAYNNVLSFLGKPVVKEGRPKPKEKQVDSDALYVQTENGKVPKFSRREKFVTEVADANPLIARAMVNRIWAILMGRGLVHPVDKMDSAHPASHPELLDWLSRDFSEHGYDIKRLIAAILKSRTYQLDSKPSAANIPEELFAFGLQKPLSAEVIYRSLKTGLNDTAGPHPTRGNIELLSELRKYFGEVVFVEKNSTLEQTLFLSNHPAIQKLTSREDSRLTARLIDKPEPTIVVSAFVQLYGRNPSTEEVERSIQFLTRPQANRESSAQHLVWAMINSSEFWINH